jgi:hypothetical protein
VAGNECLTADLTEKSLVLAACDANDVEQKWRFGEMNMKLLKNWDKHACKIK